MTWMILAQQAAVGRQGFLSTRGSFMLDFVFVAMFAIVPIMWAGILLVRFRGERDTTRCEWHKRIQIALASVLAVAVTAFEVDLNLITRNWRPLAEPSPYYASGIVDGSLWLHLALAIPTPLIWAYVIVQALRGFPRPAAPGRHSRHHMLWGRIAALFMTGTAVTGWIFYWLAFAA